MDTVADRGHRFARPLAAATLLWPAVWNGYPIVFADTGTYLSQAIHHYIGWDRPPFYSLAILPLHLTWSLWPVAVAQAALATWVLSLVWRSLTGRRSWWGLTGVIGVLAVATPLPWLVSTVMPDVLTPLLVLVMGLLGWAQFSRGETWALGALMTLMIAAQQSSVVLAGSLLLILGILRQLRRYRALLLPLLVASAALITVNIAAFGRVSLSPFGNVFLLARVIYDGPGQAVLQRDCPTQNWRLCPWRDRLPADSDDFLWRPDSPVMLAGGHKAVSADAGAIIRAALRDEPVAELRAVARNGWEQLNRFASGDGLQAWPAQVDPWMDQDFRSAAYHAARQQCGTLAVPDWLAAIHQAFAIAGIVSAALLLISRRRIEDTGARFMLLALLTLPLSAAITGGLSTPHDRYQSRIVWLPACVSLFVAAGTRRA
jgi:hypothetical protein